MITNFLNLFEPLTVGTYKVRNEMKRNQRNQLKQNEIDWYEENGRKKNKRQNEIKKLKKKDNSIF